MKSIHKYPYHKALPSTERDLSSWVNGFFRKSYYEGFELGLTREEIPYRQFNTSMRNGWEAGRKKRQLIKLVRGEYD